MATPHRCQTPFRVADRIDHRLRTAGLALAAKIFRLHIDAALRPQIDPPNAQPLNVNLSIIAEALGRLLFGCGTLGGTVFQWNTTLLAHSAAPSLGQTLPPANGRGPLVEMDPTSWQNGNHPPEIPTPTDSMMTTLLHEEVHALMYSEACKGQCGKPACSLDFEYQLGKHGHGDAWMRVAASVQRFVHRYGLWNCDSDSKRHAQRHWDDDRRFPHPDTIRHVWPLEMLSLVNGQLVWADSVRNQRWW